MIPISDMPEQKKRIFPLVTLLLIAVNVAVFLYQLSLGSAVQQFIFSYGVVPAAITTGRAPTPEAPDPIYLTLLTSMFLHGGLLHLGGNMLYLWVFGDNVEDALGHLGYIFFYALAGIAAGAAQVVSDPTGTVPGIGASGAIAGILAGYLVLFPTANIRTLLFIGPFITMTRVKAFLLIGFWFVIQLISGLVELTNVSQQAGGVAFWAHIGGFAAGLIVMALWRIAATPRSAEPIG